MRMARDSPLVEIAMSYVRSPMGSSETCDLSSVRQTLTSFVKNELTFSACCDVLTPILGTSEPISKVLAILQVPDNPLPIPAASTDSNPPHQLRAKTRPWSPTEDQRLLAGVHRFGLDDWQVVASFVGSGRTKAQCAQRWHRGLDPKISKYHWSRDEDEKLVKLVCELGPKSWTRVAAQFANRCDVQCRYRFKQLHKEENFYERFNLPRDAIPKVQSPPSLRLTNPFVGLAQPFWLVMQPPAAAQKKPQNMERPIVTLLPGKAS
jgi:hypothetical protein